VSKLLGEPEEKAEDSKECGRVLLAVLVVDNRQG
jgi:hypothetical protein